MGVGGPELRARSDGRDHGPAGDGADAVVLLSRRGRTGARRAGAALRPRAGRGADGRGRGGAGLPARGAVPPARSPPGPGGAPGARRWGRRWSRCWSGARASGASFFGLFYLWVAVEAFYLLSRRGAALQVGLVAVAYGGVLAAVPDDRPLQHWVMVVGVGVVAGVLVAYQRGRIDALVASLDDAARTDPLTGLLNRRAFEELFENELERAHRSERTSIRPARRPGRLQGRERPLRPRGRRRRAPPGGARTCSSGSAGWTPRRGSAARSSRCCCPRPTSAARSWWPSACAAPPTAASPRTRWA